MSFYHSCVCSLLAFSLMQLVHGAATTVRRGTVFMNARSEPEPLGLSAKMASFGKDELCFCYMASEGGNSLCGNEASACLGGTTYEDHTPDTSSFLNYQDKQDVLTIPREYVKDSRGLHARGAEGKALLEKMLEAGRRVYASKVSDTALSQDSQATAQFQCIHQPGCVSVEWLHLHTFSGTVAHEGLPGTQLGAACAFGNQTVADAAQRILQQARDDKICADELFREKYGRHGVMRTLLKAK